MDLTVTHHDGYVLAKISGPLSEASRDQFRERLHPLVAAGGAKLIVDLADVPRINSPGIGSLVALVADANTHDSRVVLCSPSSFVAVVLNVTRLNTFFEIAANVDEARQRLKGPPPPGPGAAN